MVPEILLAAACIGGFIIGAATGAAMMYLHRQ